jgi:pyruvate,water dikinase
VRNQQPVSAKSSGPKTLQVSKIEQKPLRTVDKSAMVGKKLFQLGFAALGLTARFNRRFLDLREDLRFALDRVLCLLRQALLSLGKQTDLGDTVLFLKENELNGLARGDLGSADACRIAKRRYDLFMKPFDVATYYNCGRAENEFESNGIVFRGIGASPGRVQGRAKIVEDPALADIQNGDILIAKNTDPGWTPILSIVGGMVMEEGGLLNHCSIVARELGVPSVVGVRGATQQIRDNDLVTIDGGLGVVKIENDDL